MDAFLHWLDGEGMLLIARICLVILFPFSALHKIFFHKEAYEQASSSFLPAPNVMLFLAGMLEVIGPTLIIFGIYDRLAAFLMAGYCALTAVLFHPFWRYGDLFSQGKSEGRAHFFDFMKNFGLVGGFLLLVMASRFHPFSDFVTSPLSAAPMGVVSH